MRYNSPTMAKQTIIIGITGASASGKSLLASTLVQELGSEQVATIAEKSYYKAANNLSCAQREKINYDHPDAFDHDLMCTHLQELRANKVVQIPCYDYIKRDRSANTRQIGPHAIIVVEGILLLEEQNIRNLLDMSIFMDTPLDICLIRRIRRDIHKRNRDLEAILVQYETTVRPMYQQFIEPYRRYADIIVPHGGRNRIAIDVIKAQMRALLST